MDPIVLDGTRLTITHVVEVARQGRPVVIDPDAWAGVDKSRAVVDDLVERREVAYGITTGFGEFAHVTIEKDQVEELQQNLLMSHAVGVSEPLPDEVVRAMMVIRINTLVRGYSGIRRVLVERLLELLERDMIPVVPARGSVGASGDLAPLAHMALPVIGMGKVRVGGQIMDAGEALSAAGMEPLRLQAKEGLALINGTQFMTACAALRCHDAQTLLRDAQVIAAMSVEALMGSVAPYDERVHALRAHKGQSIVAANMRGLMAGSGIVESHAHCARVQDAYSLRCIPQVLGACHDLIEQVAGTVTVELNSVTDNPLVFPDGRIISQGNFHGEPVAFALDQLAIAVAEIGAISERRTERLVNPDLSEGLRAFLVDKGGLNSGFMIAQYVAAALVSENKIHAHPASVDSIPTSANQEDHVSMGSIGALKLPLVVRNTRSVLAIEALCAAQALDFKADEGLQAGAASSAAHGRIRLDVPRLVQDRILSDDVRTLETIIRSGGLRDAVAGAGITLS